MVSWYGALSGASPEAKPKGAKSVTLLVRWTLWCERNRRIFYGIKRSSGQLVASIQAEARQWILAGASKLRSIIDHHISE
jgi:hypothetical protein